jgi:hypothetical protein
MNCGETGHQQEDVATWTSFMAGLNKGAQAPLRPGGTRLVGEHRTRRLCRLRVHRPPDRRSLASSLHGRNRRRAMARDLVRWSRVLRREISVSRRHAQRIERADQTFIEAHGAYLIMRMPAGASAAACAFDRTLARKARIKASAGKKRGHRDIFRYPFSGAKPPRCNVTPCCRSRAVTVRHGFRTAGRT